MTVRSDSHRDPRSDDPLKLTLHEAWEEGGSKPRLKSSLPLEALGGFESAFEAGDPFEELFKGPVGEPLKRAPETLARPLVIPFGNDRLVVASPFGRPPLRPFGRPLGRPLPFGKPPFVRPVGKPFGRPPVRPFGRPPVARPFGKPVFARPLVVRPLDRPLLVRLFGRLLDRLLARLFDKPLGRPFERLFERLFRNPVGPFGRPERLGKPFGRHIPKVLESVGKGR